MYSVLFDLNYLYVLRVFGRRIHHSNPGVWSKITVFQSGCLVVQNHPKSQAFVENTSAALLCGPRARCASDGYSTRRSCAGAIAGADGESSSAPLTVR